MLYLGIDPGKTTGACLVAKREGRVGILDFLDVAFSSYFEWCRSWPVWVERFQVADDENVAVVCENWIQRPAAHEWRDQPVAKQIGYCLAFTHTHDFNSSRSWRFYLSEPANKPAGYKLANIPPRASHGIHWQDAVAHCYYAAHNGLPKNQRVVW